MQLLQKEWSCGSCVSTKEGKRDWWRGIILPWLFMCGGITICTRSLSLSIDLSSSDYFSGETMFGELEKISSTSSTFSLITQEDNMQSEILAINVMETNPTDFLGDTRASHHIVHKLEYFSEIFPLPEIFQIKQVQGTVKVTHWGTFILQVDSSFGNQLQHPLSSTTTNSRLHPGLQRNSIEGGHQETSTY